MEFTAQEKYEFKRILDGLSRPCPALSLYPSPPANGVVIFIGSVDAGANKTEMYSAALEPPDVT